MIAAALPSVLSIGITLLFLWWLGNVRHMPRLDLTQRFRTWRIGRLLRAGGSKADVRQALSMMGLPLDGLTDEEVEQKARRLRLALWRSGVSAARATEAFAKLSRAQIEEAAAEEPWL